MKNDDFEYLLERFYDYREFILKKHESRLISYERVVELLNKIDQWEVELHSKRFEIG